MPKDIFDFKIRTLEGIEATLESYRGSVILVVNVASKCGLTPQYSGLEELYKKYGSRKFVVLAFPCNQFKAQEPGSSNEIREFCNVRFGITFPIFEKIDVNGPSTHPLFAYLKKQKRGFLGMSKIQWNFTKFLIDRRGRVRKRFSPTTTPAMLEPEILKLLSEND